MTSKSLGYNATAEFDPETKSITVLKGSTVSKDIQYSEKFRGAAKIESLRKGTIKDDTLIKNMDFRSLSTAANFVSGRSTNGLIKWKTSDGKKIKDYLSQSKE